MTHAPEPRRHAATTVAYALSDGAGVFSRSYALTDDKERTLRHALLGLVDLGHVAAFAVGAVTTVGTADAVVTDLRHAVGGVACNAVLGAGETAHPPDMPYPTMPIPVWSLETGSDDLPEAAASAGSVTLVLTAHPTDDDEAGTTLPGLDGVWTLSARTPL